jgi:hypothetical protein
MYLQKVISEKLFKNLIFEVDILSATDEIKQDPDPDPSQNPKVCGTYPQIRIRIRNKMSRIHTTGPPK